MESQPQNPEFRNNPENFHPCPGYPQTGTLANSADPDEMLHNTASHLGLHCLQIYKQSSGTEMHHYLEISICNPLKYKMSNRSYPVNASSSS